eukprot:3763782-Amphidinium_carterae.1
MALFTAHVIEVDMLKGLKKGTNEILTHTQRSQTKQRVGHVLNMFIHVLIHVDFGFNPGSFGKGVKKKRGQLRSVAKKVTTKITPPKRYIQSDILGKYRLH